jgi:hypothetical protein
MRKQQNTKKSEVDLWGSGLVGRCFVRFELDRTVAVQGIVRAKITDTVYLVQYFDWIMGEPSTLELVPLDSITGDGSNSQQAGRYEFFEDSEHLRFWLEHEYQAPRKDREDANPDDLEAPAGT